MKQQQVPAGTMAYRDVGDGPPVVFVHGNPSSSAEFVPAIASLQATHRCIAPDHLGFGASDKPPDWDYRPASHAANLARLLDPMDLRDVTMVVGDWGGPIGLSWVLTNPERVRGVVLTNTWLWPVNRSLYYQGYSKVMGGPVGRLLTERFHFFAKQVTKQAWGTATPLTPEILSEFTGVHPRPEDRKAMWVLPREVVGSSEWLAELWSQRAALHDLEMHIVWGMSDVAFRKDILDRWTTQFPHAHVDRLQDVGHFPALEATDRVVEAVLSVSSEAR